MKAVIFDCFGVLYVPMGEDFYRSRIANYESLRPVIEDLGRQADYGLISQEDLAIQIAELAQLDVALVRDRLVKGMVRNQALLEFSQSLRQAHKVALLSNITMRTMDSFFTPQERQQFFDVAVISSEVGMIKPHPEIFEYTAQLLAVDTTECVMLDDSQANCAGAVAAGMQAVVYQTTEQAIKDIKAIV